MFKVLGVGFFKFSSPPDFGLTLFSNDSSNFLYVAETDNYYNIIRFVPILETDFLTITPLVWRGSMVEGDSCPIASRTISGAPMLLSIGHLLEFSQLQNTSISSLFDLDYVTIVGLKEDGYLNTLLQVSSEYFSDTNIAKNWLSLEVNGRRASEIFWKSIDESEKKNEITALMELGFSSLNDALIWLREERNFHNKYWTSIWRIACEEMPYSKDLYALSALWIVKKYELTDFDNPYDAYIYLEIMKYTLDSPTDANENQQIYDIVEEIFTLDRSLISYLTTSHVSLLKILRLAEDNGNWDLLEHANSVANLRRQNTRIGI